MATQKPINPSKSIRVCVESFNDDAGYVAWIDNEKFKGIVVQANSKEKVFEELLTSVNAKFAYDFGITIGGVEAKIQELMKATLDCDGRKEINLNFA
ncbi:MAG: hypothetical protein WKF85_13805 [Chitinophagaceae bacterium]